MNIAKLNTVSLDDKTFIIKRGTSVGGSTPDTPSGGESGDNWVYCNSELWNSTAKSILPLYASLAKGSVDLGNGAMQVVLTPLMLSSYGATSISAYAFNLSAQMANPSMQYTIKEAMIADGVYDIIKQTEITKDQFYSLD